MTRILVADDDGTSRLELTAIASRLGHECLVATDGSSAWELLASEKVDVLLTDWMMPGLDGLLRLRALRLAQSVAQNVKSRARQKQSGATQNA